MTDAALLFFATFAVVFLLGIQQVNVAAGLRLRAFVTSIGITAASLALYKVLPGPTTISQLGAHFLGGAFGILASMWIYPQLAQTIGATIPMLPANRALDQLSTRIADEAARSDIQTNCQPVTMGLLTWYDTSATTPDSDHSVQESVNDSLRYLSLRGLVLEHPMHPELVRLPASRVSYH